MTNMTENREQSNNAVNIQIGRFGKITTDTTIQKSYVFL